MRARTAAASVVSAAGLVIALAAMPAMTAHALQGHLFGRGSHGLAALVQFPVMVLILGLVLAGTLPLMALARTLHRWWQALRTISALRDGSTPASRFGITFRRLPGDTPLVFTAGFWKPEIFVSDGAEHSLPAEALRAALLHERAHQRAGDVSLLALLQALEEGLGWLPGVRSWTCSLKLRQEVRADRSAIENGAEPVALFDAIVTLADAPVAGAGLAGSDAMARLEILAHRDSTIPLSRRGPASLVLWLTVPPGVAHGLAWVGAVCGAHFP